MKRGRGEEDDDDESRRRQHVKEGTALAPKEVPLPPPNEPEEVLPPPPEEAPVPQPMEIISAPALTADEAT
jgi:hypothetical protein